MAYQVLARKWRPRGFEQVVGQQHVLKALINALKTERLHHAYLFTGTRGVGKTTIARIFAKCLNCEQGVTPTPCDQCSACISINEGRFVDLIEVDAASRTKVEDTRELLDNVQYAPTQGRYKVYLIDEVHMLSGHSFNALLKTLEEPPAHVKFLLATTDPQKLPVTVLSRCLQFHLKAMPAERVVEYLKTQLDQEQIQYEVPALAALARAAEGSMRDALSLLDQAIAFTNGHVTTSDVHAMLGTIEHDYLYRILECLTQNDGAQILQISAELAELAVDFSGVLADIISLLHQLALLQMVPGSIADDEEHARLRQLATVLTPADVQLYYQLALTGRRDLPLVPNQRDGFEMVMLRLLAFRPLPAQSAPIIAAPPAAQSQPPKVHRSSPTPAATTQQNTLINTPKIESTPTVAAVIPVSAPAAIPTSLDWPDLITKLNLSGPVLSLASQCALKTFADNEIHLELEPRQVAFLTDKIKQRLQEALCTHFNSTIRLYIEATKPSTETPAATTQRIVNERQAEAVEKIQNDPHIQALTELFGAQVDPNLVKIID